jgi:hypothetical protein
VWDVPPFLPRLACVETLGAAGNWWMPAAATRIQIYLDLASARITDAIRIKLHTRSAWEIYGY